MTSDIPPSSLENKFSSVLNEFINPNIGNMDGSRINGILVEEEKVCGNIDFVRGGGEHCPFSNGDREGVGGPRTAEPVLWDDWEDFRITGSVSKTGDLCFLSNTDFHIEASELRGNWKDGEYFMVDSLGRNVRIDCPNMLLAVADWMNTLQVERENFEQTTCYTDMYPDLTRGKTNEDDAMSRKSQSSAGSNCGWFTTKPCSGQHKAAWDPVPCYDPPNLNELIHYGDYEPICWDAIEKAQVEREAIASDVVSCYEEYESVKQDELLDKIELVDWIYKGAYSTSLKNGELLGDFQASGEAGFPRQLEESSDRQHRATWEPVPCYEPPSLNELIHYGDYEPICWDAIEKTQVEREAIASDVVSCSEEYKSVKQDELLDKIELVDWSYKGAYLTSLKDGALLGDWSYKGAYLTSLKDGELLGDFQASGEAGFPRQVEESNDRQHRATWEPVPSYEPPNLNELIHYGDCEPFFWDAIEKTQVEREAIASNVVSCYEEYELVKQDELLEKIELVDWNYKGAYLTSLKDGALLGDFQASGEAGFLRQLDESNDRQQESSAEDRDGTVHLRLQALLGYLSTALGDLLSRQLEETNDRLQESPPKNRDGTGNIRVQAALGDLSMKPSAYYDSCKIDEGGTITFWGSMEGCSDGELAERREPHFALFLTLQYLDLEDLISLEKVCKSLHTSVKGDSSLWQNIHVEHPLSERLTDDALLELAARSQGRLRNLSLIKCRKITDDGLKQVLDISPNLTKLCLPGCTRLTGDGIVRNVRAHKEWSITGLKQLRLHGIFGITRQHLEQLNYLLDGGLQRRSQTVKPRFYPNGRDYPFSYDDDSIIDIEACPKCRDARIVYDCTNECCQIQRHHTVRECRACIFCIARCDVCGKCIDGEYEETFFLETRCADCVYIIRRIWLW